MFERVPEMRVSSNRVFTKMLHFCAGNGLPRHVEWLLGRSEVDPNEFTGEGHATVCLAILWQRFEVVRLFLESPRM
jgi:hypothetical protein